MVQLVDQQPRVLFGLLAHGDVQGRAQHSRASAGLLENPAPLGRDPPQQPVFLADGAVFDIVESPRVRIDGGREGLGDPGTVVRMQAGVEIGHGDRLTGRNPEHSLHPRLPEKGVGDQIEVPKPHFRRVRGQPQLLLATGQGPGGAMRLGDVEAFAEDAADVAGVVQDGRVDEVQEALADQPGGPIFQPRRHLVGHLALARGVGVVEHLVEALALELREDLAHRLADEVARAEQSAVGLVHELIDVVRSGQGADEAGGLLEQSLLPLLLLRLAAGGEHALGGLRHSAEHPRDLAGFVAHGGIGEGEPGLLVIAAAVHQQRQVLAVGRVASHGGLDQGRDVVPDFAPDVVEARAQGGRVLGAQDLRIGVIVEEAELRTPGDEHRELGIQQEADDRTQRLWPIRRRTERRARPVVRPHERAHQAAPRQERQGASGLPLWRNLDHAHLANAGNNRCGV